MKKTLLLSVVASSMIMAGGDIAPVEPVVETPAVAEASGWDFGGQAVAYVQTVDNSGNDSLFDDETTYKAVGAQLRATNKDVFAGIGAGIEVSAIRSGRDQVAGFYTGGGNTGTTSGGISQAYLTYGIGNTSLKLGRQTLPKGLSPFAFTEGWQMFKNTFDAALVVNSDLPDTTLVYAYVKNSNRSVGDYMNEHSAFGWDEINPDNGVHMLTAQNKSIEGLTLTGTYYMAPELLGDTSILWGDAKFKISDFSVALQGGQVSPDAGEDTTAFGAKVGAKLGMFNLSAAYSSVDGDGTLGITNLGTGIKSPLYTQMVLNNVGQYHAAPGSEFIKVGGTAKVLGGTVKAFYGMGTNDDVAAKGDYSQLDLMYITKLTKDIKLFTAYVYTDDDASTGTAGAPSENNFVRVWARYSF